MVLISTDKAVDPTSVMGATKRIAEFILPKADDGVRFCAVRFGNVLGSAGSVVPVFRSQIERGGPITLTHEDVERYFMTIPEAVQLVLHATAMSAADAGPEPRKFILEMGRPVKIRELAEKMIEVYGYTVGEDIKIEITGLKPGEKLTERLLDDDEVVIGAEGLVSEIVSSTKRRSAGFERTINRLVASAEAGDAEATRTLLQRVVNAARGLEAATTAAEEEAAA
jgi:O-antigen biosynthesis protein WbqV